MINLTLNRDGRGAYGVTCDASGRVVRREISISHLENATAITREIHKLRIAAGVVRGDVSPLALAAVTLCHELGHAHYDDRSTDLQTEARAWRFATDRRRAMRPGIAPWNAVEKAFIRSTYGTYVAVYGKVR